MIFPVLLPVVLLYSCKKDDQTTTSQPVVQAYLLPGSKLTVRLYAQKSLTDTAKYGAPLTGLKLNVSDGTNTITLTESSKGVYTYADTTFLVSGKTYSLSFTYHSTSVSAKTTMPARPQGFATQYASVDYTFGSPGSTPDTINRFTWLNPDSVNHVLVFNNLDGTSFPTGAFARGGANFEEDTKRQSVYYVLPQIFAYYGHYQVILLSVNQEYIDLLKSNTRGANSQSLLNTPTNIVNGFGIFTAMQADTVNFNFL
jgi:hypothetical protein